MVLAVMVLEVAGDVEGLLIVIIGSIVSTVKLLQVDKSEVFHKLSFPWTLQEYDDQLVNVDVVKLSVVTKFTLGVVEQFVE